MSVGSTVANKFDVMVIGAINVLGYSIPIGSLDGPHSVALDSADAKAINVLGKN